MRKNITSIYIKKNNCVEKKCIWEGCPKTTTSFKYNENESPSIQVLVYLVSRVCRGHNLPPLEFGPPEKNIIGTPLNFEVTLLYPTI